MKTRKKSQLAVRGREWGMVGGREDVSRESEGRIGETSWISSFAKVLTVWHLLVVDGPEPFLNVFFRLFVEGLPDSEIEGCKEGDVV